MEPTPAFAGFSCPDCGPVSSPTLRDRCPDCDSVLSIAIDDAESRPDHLVDEYDDQRRFARYLPFDPASVISLGEGATPLVDAPSVAADLDVDRVLIKDEGRNPTGSVVDRGLSLAITAANQRGTETVVLPTTGHGGQSAAAYAGRAGLDSRSFVPTRSSHLTKAMVNVHGGDMQVVEGRYPDAVEAFEAWIAERKADEAGEGERSADDEEGDRADPWVAVDAGSPFRKAGAKLLVHELAATLDWKLPDAIVVPTGHGVALAGAHAAIEELRANGRIDAVPKLVAAQAEGCAPIVRAIEGGHGDWEQPDTIAGSIEIAAPARGQEAVAAVRETDGEGVAVPDDALLANAVDETAATGLEISLAGGTGLAGARRLADAFDVDDTVVVINPLSGSKESDVLRSELMSRGQ